jgi:hypothetical protein
MPVTMALGISPISGMPRTGPPTKSKTSAITIFDTCIILRKQHRTYRWYIELNNGEYKLVPYGIHQKTKVEWENSESNQQENKSEKGDEKENIVSKAASQVGEMVKQIVEAGSSAVKKDS